MNSRCVPGPEEPEQLRARELHHQQVRLWIKSLWQPLCSSTIFSFKLFLIELVRPAVTTQSIQLYPAGPPVDPWLIIAVLLV